jgi:tRNA modification GTPase
VDTDSDTIFALSSGGLPSGVAVVRLSGSNAFSTAEAMVGPLPEPRRTSLRTIRTRNGSVIDSGIVIAFRSPHSFTGEDCVELQIHGGKAVVLALLDELATFRTCRMAQNGEFSRRALENGKLDLVEIEGLADLIAAETEMQRRLALEQSQGGLSLLYRDWADRITRARALIEAELDFADEDDVPGSVSTRVWSDMTTVLKELRLHLAAANYGEVIRDGFKVVIAGPPNSGKSSLLNALAARDVAIVTEIEGTTRDVLQLDLDIEGFVVKLFDTAGIRETNDVIEVEGIRRAMTTVRDADLVLSLAEIGRLAITDFPNYRGPVVKVGTKADLVISTVHGYDVTLSARTGIGLNGLRQAIIAELAKLDPGHSLAIPSRLRHRELISQAAVSLERALETGNGLDIRAEYLRLSSASLGSITGHVGVEDLLDVIFSEFCIGK